MIAIALSAVAPGFALLSYFYLRHELEAEPLGYVIRSFVAGAILVFPIMFIQYALVEEGVLTSPFWKSFIATAFLEEFFKWFMILMGFSMRSPVRSASQRWRIFCTCGCTIRLKSRFGVRFYQ